MVARRSPRCGSGNCLLFAGGAWTSRRGLYALPSPYFGEVPSPQERKERTHYPYWSGCLADSLGALPTLCPSQLFPRADGTPHRESGLLRKVLQPAAVAAGVATSRGTSYVTSMPPCSTISAFPSRSHRGSWGTQQSSPRSTFTPMPFQRLTAAQSRTWNAFCSQVFPSLGKGQRGQNV